MPNIPKYTFHIIGITTHMNMKFVTMLSNTGFVAQLAEHCQDSHHCRLDWQLETVVLNEVERVKRQYSAKKDNDISSDIPLLEQIVK